MSNNKPNKNFVLIMLVYLLGIFMGALDTGIVTPARTIIQSGLGVDEKTGIWMITIYTLAYAASIPIMGKLADKFGRKYIYLLSITLFGMGSLFCGLSNQFGSFELLLLARVIQALGGGGIVPIANAEFGTTFPEEKRGLALGLIGGVYGIANIFGSSAGSLILDIFGSKNWQYIFYINVPITVFILIAGMLTLKNHRSESVKKLDFVGITTLTLMVLSLLYGLKQIDFFDFKNTLTDIHTYPYLIAFVVLLPIFIFAEKKAQDPVLNLHYFKNISIIITMIISFITGIIIMGMIFVPQFAENALKIPSGDGGYFVIILGVFAGVGAPLSGKFIDKFGAKKVLMLGFLASITGSLFLIFVTTSHPGFLTVFICLMFTGLGIGFTMGTPVNYMMLANTDPSESTSALAAVSLVRSIGTAIAPAIMVGFISHAGMNIQTNIMPILPKEITMTSLPNLKAIDRNIDNLKNNPMFSSMMDESQLPDISSFTTMKMDMTQMSGSSNTKLPKDILTKLQSSDVTTITDNTVLMSKYMLDGMTPMILKNINSGIDSGIQGLEKGAESIKSIPSSQSNSKVKRMGILMEKNVELMKELQEEVPTAFEKAKESYYKSIQAEEDEIQTIYQDTLNKGFKQIYLTVTITSLLAILVLFFYKEKSIRTKQA